MLEFSHRQGAFSQRNRVSNNSCIALPNIFYSWELQTRLLHHTTALNIAIDFQISSSICMHIQTNVLLISGVYVLEKATLGVHRMKRMSYQQVTDNMSPGRDILFCINVLCGNKLSCSCLLLKMIVSIVRRWLVESTRSAAYALADEGVRQHSIHTQASCSSYFDSPDDITVTWAEHLTTPCSFSAIQTYVPSSSGKLSATLSLQRSPIRADKEDTNEN